MEEFVRNQKKEVEEAAQRKNTRSAAAIMIKSPKRAKGRSKANLDLEPVNYGQPPPLDIRKMNQEYAKEQEE